MAGKTADPQSLARVCMAGLLAWLMPGLGHIAIGHRARGLIYLITIGITFWGGVAIGGVQDTVNPDKRFAWFLAQICTGTHGLVAYAWGNRLRAAPDAAEHANYVFKSVDIAVVYTGLAGLLNLLAILDALARAEAPDPRRVLSPAAAQAARGSP